MKNYGDAITKEELQTLLENQQRETDKVRKREQSDILEGLAIVLIGIEELGERNVQKTIDHLRWGVGALVALNISILLMLVTNL
jgi:hypothetical protein